MCGQLRRTDKSAIMERRRFCYRCVAVLFDPKELPYPASLTKPAEPPPEGIRTRSTVKWWDPKLGIWRWVAKASKPPLSPK